MTKARPQLTDLLTRPRSFFTALQDLPERSGRYLWLVLLTGLLGGLYAALVQKPVQDALGTLPGLSSGSLSLALAVAGGLFGTLLLWLFLWGLGRLGAGTGSRAAEVFGAGFLPSLLVSLILLPFSALFPLQITTPAPNVSGLQGLELAQAIQRYSLILQREVSGQPLSVIGNVLSYAAIAWQFYLAYVGFGVITSDRGRALRGTLVPLGIGLLLAGVLLLLTRAAQGMIGGGG